MEIQDIISSGLLELYALGMANEQEIAQVEAWVKQYPEVAAELSAIESGMETYAMANAIQPASSVKDKIFAEINEEEQTTNLDSVVERATPVVSFWKNAAAAAILLLIGSVIFNIVYYNKYNKANHAYADAVEEKDKLQNDLAGLQESNNEMKNDMFVIQSKYSQPVTLNGLPAAPEAAAKIFWMKNTGDVYIDPSNLPDAPTGKQYQLWAIVDGQPVDAGLILTTKKGDKLRFQKMKSFGSAQAFAVTLETEGGNPTPKGDMYVMGKL